VVRSEKQVQCELLELKLVKTQSIYDPRCRVQKTTFEILQLKLVKTQSIYDPRCRFQKAGVKIDFNL
jgi:hypothetical protein